MATTYMHIYHKRMHAHKLHVIHEDVTQIPFKHECLNVMYIKFVSPGTQLVIPTKKHFMKSHFLLKELH